MEEFERLHKIISQLRAPNGCPWDREQTHESLKPYLVEEAYETLEALDKNDPALLCEELGDLLLQIVLHSVIAEEHQDFTFGDVAQGVADKMVRRHPHVFADTKVAGVKDVWKNWEQIKKTEKNNTQQESILDSIPASLPSLFRATKIQKKAARVGFDFTETSSVLEKIKSVEEFGDVLFSLVNLSRKLDIDAEDALRLATKKFENRFRYIEKQLKQENKDFKDCSPAELDTYWNKANEQ